jgi:hypothetical protein
VSGVKRFALAALVLASIPACSPAAPAQAPEAAKEAASAEPAAPAAPSAEASAAPEAPKAAPAAADSPAQTLARDLIKAGGRRIGWSATKKRFVVPIDTRTDAGRGLDLRFYDDEGAQREIKRVCQPGECDEHLNEIAKDLIPALTARFESEGYEAVYSIGWPSGRDEIDVSSLEMKLRYDKGRLSAVREKKPATPLRTLGGRSPKGALTAIYPVPAAKLVGAVAEGEKEFFLFKLP